MYDEKLLPAGADPLRYIDVRFEPQDPVFDAEEPLFGRDALPLRHRSRRSARSAVQAAGLLDSLTVE
jgi:hypothetical protein